MEGLDRAIAQRTQDFFIFCAAFDKQDGNTKLNAGCQNSLPILFALERCVDDYAAAVTQMVYRVGHKSLVGQLIEPLAVDAGRVAVVAAKSLRHPADTLAKTIGIDGFIAC